jgi:hypothetical protein
MADDPLDYTDDTTVFPLMTDLLGCIDAQITKRKMPPVDLVVGTGASFVIDLTECDCDGTAWVRLANGFASMNFPNADATAMSSNPAAMAYQLEVGIARPAPVSQDGGQVDYDAMFESARLQMADMTALRAAICACLGKTDRSWLLDAYVPLGPEGGNVQGAWTVRVSWTRGED